MGVLDENEMEGYVEVAEPVGVIAGVTPTTNPTSTTLFKSLIAVKTRNPIIFRFPPVRASARPRLRIVYEAAVKAGAPENCIQWIDTPSIEATGALMNHPGVATILATGGPGMVKAAYSCGKPALGVGPGNVPCYIEKIRGPAPRLHRPDDVQDLRQRHDLRFRAGRHRGQRDRQSVRRLYEGQQLLLPQQRKKRKS